MLVLSRKPEESLLLGRDIRLTVLRVDGITVSLGIEAPASVMVWREEVLRRLETDDGQAQSTR
jgi:carbon storage regulator